MLQSVMEKAYPVVPFDTPVERLSNLISKETGAVLSKDDSGNYHIVTKYDIIQSLVKFFFLRKVCCDGHRCPNFYV